MSGYRTENRRAKPEAGRARQEVARFGLQSGFRSAVPQAFRELLRFVEPCGAPTLELPSGADDRRWQNT